MVVRLSRQIVDMNAFAFFVDVVDRCARLPFEASAFMDAIVSSATRLDKCVSGGGCERHGVKTGIDFAEVVSIWGAIHDGSFGMRWWEFEFHLGKLTARRGKAGGLGSGNGGGCRCGVMHVNELQSGFHLSEKPCH